MNRALSSRFSKPTPVAFVVSEHPRCPSKPANERKTRPSPISAAGMLSAMMPAAVKNFARMLATVVGWRRLLLAFLFGALAVAAQPPVHFLPVLLISFPVFIWLLDGATTWRSAFGVGWMFGAGYFAAGLYWVPNALLVDAARFAWLIPFAVLGLSLGLGLFIGGAAVLGSSIRSTSFSPNRTGSVLTRKSMDLVLDIFSLMRPSCGTRLSEISILDITFNRAEILGARLIGGLAISCSTPSVLNLTR